MKNRQVPVVEGIGNADNFFFSGFFRFFVYKIRLIIRKFLFQKIMAWRGQNLRQDLLPRAYNRSRHVRGGKCGR